MEKFANHDSWSLIHFDVTVLPGIVDCFFDAFSCFYMQVLSKTLGRRNYVQILAVAHRRSGSWANFSKHVSKIVQARLPRPPNFTSPQYPVATPKGLPSQSQGSQVQVFTSCNWGLFLKILYLLARSMSLDLRLTFLYLFHLLVTPFIAVPEVIGGFSWPPSTICSKPIQHHCSPTQSLIVLPIKHIPQISKKL